MSAAEVEIIDGGERSESKRPLLVRTFEATMSAGDGRTIEMRIVPFGERATVADGLGGVPKGVPYEEEWMPGVFDPQLNAAHRVLLNFEHGEGLANVVGRGLELAQRADGYHGAFRVLEGADGNKALELVREGVLPAVSLQAFPKKSIRSKAGVIQRVKAHLDAVALCRVGAYAGAQVTALRTDEDDDSIFDEELFPVDIDPALVERCLELGLKIPDRMDEAIHRAFTDIAWDGSSSRWDTAEAYCSASAIDLNKPGAKKTKDACYLPFKEPGSGAINVGGVRAALSRLGQGLPKEASQGQRDAAASRLRRLLASYNADGGN